MHVTGAACQKFYLKYARIIMFKFLMPSCILQIIIMPAQAYSQCLEYVHDNSRCININIRCLIMHFINH